MKYNFFSRLAYLSLIILSLFIFDAVSPAHTALAQFTNEAERSTYWDKLEAERLREKAESYRKNAKRSLKRAEGYRELQKNAEENARTLKTPEYKAMWERDAKDRANSAERNEKDAAEGLEKAEAFEAEAQNLEKKVFDTLNKAKIKQTEFDKEVKRYREERAAKKANERNKNTCQFENAQELIGMWQYEDQEKEAEAFAIVNKDPEMEAVYPNNLELHNSERVWKGDFNTQKKLPKDKPRMVFKYKPKAKEINREDIPNWAREKIAGELEWELEIWAECKDGATMAVSKFFPGEVQWDADTKKVSIKGRGEERKFYLIPQNYTIIEALAKSSIGIRLADGTDPFIHPVEGLSKKQRFFIDVRLPEEMAKEVGNNITVNIKGLTGNDSETVKLQAGAVRGGNRPVRYSHLEAITIANKGDEEERDPQVMSMSWIAGASGARIDLDVENAEIVEFSYKDLKFEVPIYNSWVQIGNARFAKSAEQVRTVLNSILMSPYSKKQKTAAHKRIRLLANYQALIYSKNLNDLHRYKMGELYLGTSGDGSGLVSMTDAELDAAYWNPRDYHPFLNNLKDPVNPLLKSFLSGLSGKDMSIKSGKVRDEIAWVHKTEKQKVLYNLRKTSLNSRKELVGDFYKNLSYGLYQGITSATNADSLYLVITGKDIFGRKAPKWARLTTAVGLGSAVILKVAGPSASKTFSKRRQNKRFGLPKKTRVTLRSRGSSAVNLIDNIVEPPGARTMSASKRRQTVVLAVDEPLEALKAKKGSKIKGPNCALKGNLGGGGFVDDFAEEAAFERALRDLTQDPDPANSINAQYLKRAYPNDLKIAEDYSKSFAAQSPNRATCQAKAFEWIMKKRTGFEIGENELHTMINDLAFEEFFSTRKNPKKAFYAGYGYNAGYENWMIRKLGRSFGLKVSEVAGKVSLRAIRKYIEKGAGVKAVIKLDIPASINPNGGLVHSYHAVSIEDIVINARGYATRVKFFDSNVSAVLELPAREFKRLLLKEDIGYGNITVFQ